ncbi:POM121-like protein 2 [Erinaceus europaeus]|uniref:POM121-like protein 2 n=1 Tax=Erinaceus europaeus TaxID=9365 RepID=A0ABM3WTP0_ERIEU|nr:POM121-like protein 2 [Erinaceus europaeus]
MGSYLGKSGPPQLPPAQEHTDWPESPGNRRPAQPLHHVHRVQHVHRAHPAPRYRPARRPPNWNPDNPTSWGVREAWMRFPMRKFQNSILGPLSSDWWESYFKRSVWSLRHPRAIWSPVTIKIAPPEQPVPLVTSPAEVIKSAGSSPSEKHSDPCAKETVLRILKENKKERVGLEEPFFPENLDCKSPETKPSAFKPLMRNGVFFTSYEPRPGPLKRGLYSWSSVHSLNKRPSCCSSSSLTYRYTGSSLSFRRNAIASSYSSSRDLSESWKRSAPSESFQMPEWPMKKREKGHQFYSPVPLITDKSPQVSSNSGLPSPGDMMSLTPPQQLGYILHEGNLTLGKKLRLQWNNKARDNMAEANINPTPETQSASQPLSLTLPSTSTAPTQDTHSPVENLKKIQESPHSLTFSSSEEAINVTHSSLKTPSLLPPLGHSPSKPHAGTSSDSKLKDILILLTPVSPTSTVTDTTWPPLTPQADRSTVPQHPSVNTPMQSTLLGMTGSPAPHYPASMLPTATSADSTSNLSKELPPSSETGISFCSRISATVAVSSTQSIATSTFKPNFGSIASLKTMSVNDPSIKETSIPETTASPLSHDLIKTTSVIMSTPENISKDSASKSASDSGIANATSTMRSTSSCHMFLLGAASAFRTSISPATGLISPPCQQSTIPTVQTVTATSDALPSAVQILSSTSTANLGSMGSPLSATTPATRDQPSLLTSNSNSMPAVTVPLVSNSKSPFPLTLGIISQTALGVADRQKQGGSQPNIGPNFSSSFILGNSAVVSSMPTPTSAHPAFSRTTQFTFAGLTPSTSTFHIPARICSYSSSAPASFSFDQASTSSLGVVTQTHQSGNCGSVFGSTAPRPFAFGGLVTPMDCSESGVSVTGPDMSCSSGAFSNTIVSNRIANIATPFGKTWSQNTHGLTSESTPFSLGRARISAGKNALRGPPMAPFAQSTPVPGRGFGMPSSPTQRIVGKGPFRASTSSFSIGLKPKTPKSREQGHSRRHHAHRK